MPVQDDIFETMLRTWEGKRAQHMVQCLRLGILYCGGIFFLVMFFRATLSGFTLPLSGLPRVVILCVVVGALWGLGQFAVLEFKWRRRTRAGGEA